MSPIANDHPTVVKIADLDQKIANQMIRIGVNGCHRAGARAVAHCLVRESL
jgi:hypothetical protein